MMIRWWRKVRTYPIGNGNRERNVLALAPFAAPLHKTSWTCWKNVKRYQKTKHGWDWRPSS